ncbi:putative manganese ion homeostasis [Talaromyces proteolyticus]|uniref:Manganese ion homeostasis n=1 Tax=Talaromyces proteolyticus TaxID=1131652 RepID=A0AAD4KHX9_9EURO|nr:putative manganese ion homeostasis [Talaromyces proteolyticus]KAH8692086.1 putative manganese ion homeostasis [Talaromyces proteolyticus]
MSYAYSRGGPGAASNRSYYDEYDEEEETLLWRASIAVYSYARHSASESIEDVKSRFGYGRRPRKLKPFWQEVGSTLKAALCVANFLAAIWIFTLWWGERTVFQETISQCYWDSWEKWPENATPHHIVFIADPQLVDPHTYPGRPWPLSTLTVKFTDQYMRRAFSLIERQLVPDSVLFLGDLFDGGREWSTATSTSPEEQYRKYGDKFWIKEYNRFSKIFFRQWNQPPVHSAGEARGRKLIASLPGNHDLGFGSGVQDAVRRRFQAYFGQGNRVDILGNHTFVSIDTVSLSAMDQPDPKTGSSGIGAGDGHLPNEEIWSPTENWLREVKDMKARVETEELRLQRNQSEGFKFKSGIQGGSTDTIIQKAEIESQGFPTVLLTHVPLYRKPATPCGPLRERFPPSSTDPIPEQDERNALKINGGYQYQNVLTPTISNEIVSKIGSDISHVYSGDDHDYCEIVHREFSGSPKEITVKSLSWAMGVRHPGFVMTTLWNPIDLNTGKSLDNAPTATIQNHLCLLPDQLGVFIRYALVFCLTIAVLFVRAVVMVFLSFGKSPEYEPTLPFTEQDHLHMRSGSRSAVPPSLSVTSATSGGDARLSNRNSARDLAALDSTKSHHIDEDVYSSTQRYDELKNGNLHDDDDKWKSKVSLKRQSGRGCTGPASTTSIFTRELKSSIKHVAFIVFPFYFWLIFRW